MEVELCIATIAARSFRTTPTSARTAASEWARCTARKRLVRPRAERKIAGVCAGLAEYFDLDVTLVRVLWLIVTFFSGIIPGIIGYVVAWIVMPEEPEYTTVPQAQQVTTP